jgi:hypothetical protein
VGRHQLGLPAGLRSARTGARTISGRWCRGWLEAAVLGFALLVAAAAGPARAEQIVALYSASWAGLPAGQIRLSLDDGKAGYDDRIAIASIGLPRMVTHFLGTARAVGELAPHALADPARYDALYDLHKLRNSRISMRFIGRGPARIAERGARDTSHKPPLAAAFRRGTVDPVTAVERLREAIATAGAADRSFSIPVYDGVRRFDVVGRILPKSDQTRGLVKVELTLRPIAGFKGATNGDGGDPDDAPRPVALTLSGDARLLPLALTVRVYYLPLVVRLDHLCTTAAPCPGEAANIAGSDTGRGQPLAR